MASLKTYILSPNFQFHPDTSICMGDIIRDPGDPTRPLRSLPESSTLETESHLDYDAKLRKHTSQSLDSSAWVKFLETIDTKIGGGATDNVLNKYTMDRLETIYYRKQPTDEEAASWIQHEKVQSFINSGVFGKQPVYMITGLKVARGFRLESGITLGKSGNATLAASSSSGVSTGANLSLTRSEDIEQSHRAGQDIVFAYQLHVIAHKGWWRRHVEIEVHKPKSAFLNKKEEVEEELVEVKSATEEDVRTLDEEMAKEVFIVEEGDESCAYIVLNEDE